MRVEWLPLRLAELLTTYICCFPCRQVWPPPHAMQRIKGGSSLWIKETFPTLGDFAWQSGYGAFSVSTSQIDTTVSYIREQEKHHAIKSFQEEYLAFLERHAVRYEEDRLWD